MSEADLVVRGRSKYPPLKAGPRLSAAPKTAGLSDEAGKRVIFPRSPFEMTLSKDGEILGKPGPSGAKICAAMVAALKLYEARSVSYKTPNNEPAPAAPLGARKSPPRAFRIISVLLSSRTLGILSAMT